MKDGFAVSIDAGGRKGQLRYRVADREGEFCLIVSAFWQDGSRSEAVSKGTFRRYSDALSAAAWLARYSVTPLTLDESLAEMDSAR